MQYLFIFMDSEYHLNFVCVFLQIYGAYHYRFYSVTETSTLSKAVCNSLMLYNNIFILTILHGELQFKFQI